MSEEEKNRLIELLQELRDAMFENAEAVEKLREGDYYGDPLPDSIADIAKSLRIMSGREELN